MNNIEKLGFWMFGKSLELAVKLSIILLVLSVKYGFKFAKHYVRYAIPGVAKVLYNPKYSIPALILLLLSVVDAKFFYNTYTFNNYQHSEYVHLIILLSPFAYFYGLGKSNIAVVKEKEIIKEKVVYKEPEKLNIGNRLQQPTQDGYIEQPNNHVRDTLGWEMEDAKIIEVEIIN